MQQLIFVFSGGTESERRLQIKGKDGNLSQVTLDIEDLYRTRYPLA